MNSITRAKISPFDRFVYFLQSRASKVVVVSLVLNTMIAQLLYNSAGQLALSNRFLLGYLIASAASSTLAFALFEVSVIFALHDLMALDPSISQEIGGEKLIRRGFLVLGISSLINFISVFYFLSLAWHAAGGEATPFPLDHLPMPWAYLYYAAHAAAYTAVLFMAGIFGERPKSSKEIVLATQRALEQQATEAWQQQTQARIAQMKRNGDPLAPVAAALASPETAQRIAMLDEAMSGTITALDAAEMHATGAGALAQLRIMRDGTTTPSVARRSTPIRQDVLDDDPPDAADLLVAGDVPLEDTTGAYTPDDEVFQAYTLPAGLELMTEAPMSVLAKRLGIPAHKLSDAWGKAKMTYHAARGDQPATAKNIQVWEILALIEWGWLTAPAGLKRRVSVTA